MSREAVIQAALSAVGQPGSDDFARSVVVGAGFALPDGDFRIGNGALRSIGFPDAGEQRSAANVPLPGDLIHFDDVAPPAVIVAIGEISLTAVGPDAGVIVSVELLRGTAGTIYSLRSLLEPRGTTAERHEAAKSRLLGGETVEDLRADGVSIGEVEKAAAALVPAPTPEEKAAAEMAALTAKLKANIENEVTRLRSLKVRDAIHKSIALDKFTKQEITQDEYWALVPSEKPKAAQVAAVAAEPVAVAAASKVAGKVTK